MPVFKGFPIALTIAMGLGLTSCSDSRPRANSQTQLTDSDMERMIHERYSGSPDLAGVSVSANAAKNEATISGTVNSESLRTRAVDLAKAASPGLTVTDKIDVKPRELSRSDYTEDMARTTREKATASGDKIGKSLEDAWIHTKLTAKLMSDSDTPARKINVDVTDNTVTLRGAVKTAVAKSEAERIAKETEGVKKVVNRLQVREN